MNGKTLVRHKLDQASLPSLTEAQLAELARLAARPDDEIDYGDIPPLTEAFWRNSERGAAATLHAFATSLAIGSTVPI